MDHPFECKQIGNISDDSLLALKKLAVSLDYVTPFDWVLQQTEQLDSDSQLIQDVIAQINYFVKFDGVESVAFTRLPKMSYGPEHSDTWITVEPPTNPKVHIPIITNPMVGFMWPGYDAFRPSFVTKMDEGKIYLFNNVAKHSIVNLSQEDRYHLVFEFKTMELSD